MIDLHTHNFLTVHGPLKKCYQMQKKQEYQL